MCRTGYSQHGDYVFGWKGDALQRVLDSPCYVNCPTLETQGTASMNACKGARVVDDDIDSCRPPRKMSVKMHPRMLLIRIFINRGRYAAWRYGF